MSGSSERLKRRLELRASGLRAYGSFLNIVWNYGTTERQWGTGAIATGHGLEIDTALSGNGPIASEQVLSWIDAAADSDLLTLSKL